MSDVDLLLVLVLIVYLTECLVWVPVSAVGFVARLPWGRRRVAPARPNRAWDRGFLVAVPWPPLSGALVADPMPLLVAPNGVGTLDPDGFFLAWDRVESTGHDGKSVTINGQLAARTATVRLADQLARLVREVAPLSTQKRRTELERFFDGRYVAPDEVRRRLAEHRRCTLPMRLWVNLLWLGLFVGIPLLVYTALVRYWMPLVAWMVVGWLMTPVLFAVTLRRHPGLERPYWPGRIHRLFVAASPLAALRVDDLLVKEVTGDLDPLSVSAALLSNRAFAAHARPTVIDLKRFNEINKLKGDFAEAGEWMADQMLARVRGVIAHRDTTEQRVLAPPERTDPGSTAYCPRCLAQYNRGERCTNDACHRAPLRSFE